MSLSFSQEPSLATLKSEYEVMMALSIERKSENYTLLRGWDQMRAEQLSIHRKAVDQLAEYTEASLQLSTNYVSVIKQFLSDKHEQFVSIGERRLNTASILCHLRISIWRTSWCVWFTKSLRSSLGSCTRMQSNTS